MRLAIAFVVAALCVLIAPGPLHAGKLDLDIYGTAPNLPRAPNNGVRPQFRLLPGDPRGLQGESRWVRNVSHAGYAGLGVAGLVGALATGGIGPAIGFGVVALIHGYGLWRERGEPSQPPHPRRVPEP
ncbi:MAG: hypothetical protein HY921_13000 [Elusimicrobia bacterium]|nr:hypothetical protein [Elusimicrobiota bacterium]